MFSSRKYVIGSCLISMMAYSSIPALDTTEPFDLGFSDNELYISFTGIGADKGERRLSAEYVIGAGITESFSSMFTLAIESDEFFGNTASEFGIGLFLNSIDNEHLKLDFMTGFSSAGSLTLGTEINLDFNRFGIQLSVEEALSHGGTTLDDVNIETSVAPLVYYSVNDVIQALASIDFVLPGGGVAEIGVASVGLNAVINDAIELITEFGIDIPQDGEALTVGVSIGIVATLP